MHPVERVTRHTCDVVRPRVAWGKDNDPRVVAPDGAALESQSLPGLGFWGTGGC
jgi:hypothetical protein